MPLPSPVIADTTHRTWPAVLTRRLLVVLGLVGAGFLIFLLLGAGDASAATQDGSRSQNTGGGAASSIGRLPATIADDLASRVAPDLALAHKLTAAAVGSVASTTDATIAVPAQPAAPRSSTPSTLHELTSGAQRSLAAIVEPVIKTAASVPDGVSALGAGITSTVTESVLSNPVLHAAISPRPAQPPAAQLPAPDPATVSSPDAPATEPNAPSSAATPELAPVVPPSSSRSSAVGVPTQAGPPVASADPEAAASSDVGRRAPGMPAPLPDAPQPPALPAPTPNVPNDAGTAGSGAQAQAAVAPGRLAIPISTTCERAGGHDADRLPGTPSFQPPFSPD